MIGSTIKTELHKTVGSFDINSELLEYHESEDRKELQISFKKKHFKIERHDLDSAYGIKYWSTAHDSRIKTVRKSKEVIKYFKLFLEYIQDDYIDEYSSNPWLKQKEIKFVNINFEENQPFNLKEKNKIELSLKEAKTELVAQLPLSSEPETILLINQRIDKLSNQLFQLDKPIWKSYAQAVIFQLMTQIFLLLGEEAYNYANQIFEKVLDTIDQLPPYDDVGD